MTRLGLASEGVDGGPFRDDPQALLFYFFPFIFSFLYLSSRTVRCQKGIMATLSFTRNVSVEGVEGSADICSGAWNTQTRDGSQEKRATPRDGPFAVLFACGNVDSDRNTAMYGVDDWGFGGYFRGRLFTDTA